MRFHPPLLPGRLLRRYQRFLADVRLADGSTVTAHCPNPGSMMTCLVTEGQVWLSRHDKPSRRLKYTWEIAKVGNARVMVHPARANGLVAEAIRLGVIEELSGYDTVRPEAIVTPATRFDFALEKGQKRCYVEVKSATLAIGGGRVAFPDAKTERGVKHLVELMAAADRGHRAVLLFCASRSDARQVEPADAIDPRYGSVLREAAASGVEVIAYGCRVTTKEIRLVRRVPVVMG